MTLLLGLALAAPPVPTWTAADVEATPAGEVVAAATVPAQGATETAPAATSRARATFEAEPRGHGWVDEEALTFDLSGAVGRFYYVMATARGGGMVAHWRQGPIAGEDLTVTHTLSVPSELPELLGEVGVAHLSLVLVVVDERDREIGRARLGKTWVEERGGVVMGGVVRSVEDMTTGGWQ